MDTYEENLRVILKQNQFIEQLSGKTILLTGATGMIGKCIIDLLMQFNDNCFSEQKIRVIALSRNSENARRRLDKHWTKDCLHYYSFDVNTGIPECERADYVIHAASNTLFNMRRILLEQLRQILLAQKIYWIMRFVIKRSDSVLFRLLRFMVKIGVIQKDLRKTIWDILTVTHFGLDIRKVRGLASHYVMHMRRCSSLIMLSPD